MLLKHSEKFGLQGQAHFGHFVEKQGAFVGEFKFSFLAVDGSGEGAFFMAKHFGFQQAFRKGGAVDGHEGFIGPGTALVDIAGKKLFAGSGFSDDQYGGFAVGDVLHELEELFHLFVAGDDLPLGQYFHAGVAG